MREDAQAQSGSGLRTTGENAAGDREILGWGLGDRESEATGPVFFQGLTDGGGHGWTGFTFDDRRGWVHSILRQFSGAAWQRCQTHPLRNILDATPSAPRPGSLRMSGRSSRR